MLSLARAAKRGHVSLAGLSAGRPGASIGIVILAATVLAASLADVIAPHDPLSGDVARRLLPPAWLPGGNPDFLLGTDSLGRDLLSRIVHGARVSLLVGIAAVVLRGSIGVLIGLIAGYRGGRVDSWLMRLADLQLAVPFLVLALAVMTVLGPGLLNIILVLGVTGWVIYGRVVRADVLSVRERDYVLAARATGCDDPRIVLRHILPNVAASIVVISTLEVARMIIAEASLSFLGLGVQPPTPAWGSMVAEGRDYLATQWWLATLPGLAIFVVVMSINLVGDWLRDRLDPTLRGRG